MITSIVEKEEAALHLNWYSLKIWERIILSLLCVLHVPIIQEVKIFTDAGRAMRPLYVVDSVSRAGACSTVFLYIWLHSCSRR